MTRWLSFAMLVLAFLVATAFSQCDPNENAYMYLHPAFAGKSWTQTAYDSILVLPSDALCGLKPSQFDICGVPDSAVGVLIGQNRNMYLVRSSYTCGGGCTPCMLEYFDPSQVTLSGIALSPVSPLYVAKDNARYGNTVVKVLFATTQNQVLALSVTIANQSIAKRDTLKMSALSAGQNIIRIQGDFDTVTKKDLGVWVLGSRGLLRYFAITNDVWGNEVKQDLAIQDTVYCVGSGYAGTSSGTIYKRNAGGAFVYDSKPALSAILNVYPKGAVGRNGTVLEFSGGSWVNRHSGTGDYWYGNFTNRWNGAGVEVLDSTWLKSVYTYYDFPSRITSTQPFAYANNMTYSYNSFGSEAVTVTMSDSDESYTDFGLSLVSAGKATSLKNDGKYTILNIAGSTLCPMDSIRLKSGIIVLTLTPGQVQVSAQCMRGQYIPLCQSYSWVDYHFAASHGWLRGDSLTLTTGINQLRIANNSAPATATGDGKWPTGADVIACRTAGRALVFSVTQGNRRNLARIVLYNVQGQILESMSVGLRQTIAVSAPSATGVVYARYIFDDGSSTSRNLLLVR